MKIKSHYVIKELGNQIVVVPIEKEAMRFNGIISLNQTGKFLFETLQKEDLSKEELMSKVLERYEASKAQVEKDVESFIKKCMEKALIDENTL
jgi:DNA-binding protein H-NS